MSSRSTSTNLSLPALPRAQSTASKGTASSSRPRGDTEETVSASTTYSSRICSTTSGWPSRRSTTTISGRKSRAASSIGASESSQIICAVNEARGVSPSVGVAFVNVSTGEAILSQICDTQFYIKTLHKISVVEPSQILMVSTSCPPNPKSSLCSSIEENYPGAPVIPLDRKYWSENTGLEFIQSLAFREDVEAVKVAIEGNFYATCAFCAVMRYIESELDIRFAPHALRIRYQPSEETMMIDLSTIASLELIQNLHNSKSKDCLFGILNQTLTPMGARMLRSNILQPSTQKEGILEPRYEALTEISSNEDMFHEIRKALQHYDDVEKLLTQLIILPSQVSLYNSEQAINSVLMVKKFVLSVNPIFELLSSARCGLLGRIRDLCGPNIINPILDEMNEIINADATFAKTAMELRNQRTFTVKAGVRGLLDVARKMYKEATDDVYQHVKDLNIDLDSACDIKFDNGRKYYLRFPAADFEHRPIPEIFINHVRKKDFIECQTLSIVKLNQRITKAADEAVMMSDEVIQELLTSLRMHAPKMFKVCEGIALLDMLAALCHSGTAHDYIRPNLSGTLAIKAARHPIMDRRKAPNFIPNDYYATEQYRFQIITGCNMSGKSTYIRTAAILQIMAQIGCFVPAQYASFPIVHNLLSRVSTDDSIEANMSTFSVEMREMAFILRNINGESLVIIDELGRGTSARDGLAIAIAVAEALVQSHATVFFATHFVDLAKVLTDRAGVLSLHLETETTSEDDSVHMTMLYKVASGHVKEDDYGICLAGAVGFPARFMRLAEEVSTTLSDRAEALKRGSNARKLSLRRRLMLNLHETLQQVQESDMGEEALSGILRRLQAEFVKRMESIDDVGSESADVDAEEKGDQAGDESDGHITISSDASSEGDDLMDGVQGQTD